MRDDQIFGVIAGAALLIWLLARGRFAHPRHRRFLEVGSFALLAAGMLYALVSWFLWLGR